MLKKLVSKLKEHHQNKKPLTLKKRLIILFSFLGVFIVLFSIRYIPGVSEWYSKTVGRFFSFTLGHIFSWIPFSIFELIVIALVIAAIVWLIFFIRSLIKKGIKKTYTKPINLATVIAFGFMAYSMTFSFNYHRDPVPIPLQKELLPNSLIYKDIADYYQKDFNYVSSQLNYDSTGSVICPYSWSELNYLLQVEYEKLNSDYLMKYTPNSKPMYMLSWFYSQLQITGVSFPLTAEANFNINVPALDIPFTIAHEMAHIKGSLREEDANLYAAYICLNSENAYIRYSGYMNTFFSLGNLVRATNVSQHYSDFVNGINPNIYKDINYSNNFWKEHDLFSKISVFINDIYLMFSANETTDAYNDHQDIQKEDQGGKIIYTVNSYSPYQALLIYQYLIK